MIRSAWILALVALASPARPSGAGPVQRFFVSPAGRDAWSGRLASPRTDGTDGPFATLDRARDAVRQLRREGGTGPVAVQLRGGTYFLEAPVRFGPEDSGTAEAPVSYEAYPGERPELVGGRRITGFQIPAAGKPLELDLPPLPGSGWRFRALYVDGRREVRARYPNLDPADPIRRGFLHAEAPPGYVAFGATVGGIHGAGDWLDYRLRVPAGGTYLLWLHYGAANAAYGFRAMDGRCAVSVDGGAPVPLADLEDTGAWKPARWGRAATLRLEPGEHRLRWQNRAGGGLVLDALVLCADPRWRPEGESLPPAQGPLIALSARDHLQARAPHLVLSGAGTGPRDALWCPLPAMKPAWFTAPEAEVHIFPSGECRAFSEILAIRDHEAATGRIALGGSEALAALGPGDRFYLENVREELDAPGEWHVDAATGRLAYLPRAGFSAGSEVVVPLVRSLLRLEGHPIRGPVRHLRFAGLVLRDTDWARGGASAGYGMGEDGALALSGAEACVVEDCRFLNLGGYAVALHRGGGNTVRDCEVAHAGGGGVLVRDSAGNRITDNHLHHLGEAYAHVGGVVLTGPGASENRVAHNAIHDASRYGISLKNPGAKNSLEYNLIQNTCLETSDAGGIEVTQQDRTFRSGSVIRFNRVADTIGYAATFGVPSYLSWGIYLDSFASGYEVRGNVVLRAWNGGIMLQGGRENQVVNNVFVDGQVSQGTLANFEGQSRGLRVESNIVAYHTAAAAFVTGALGPEVIRMDRNLYFPPGGAQPGFGAGGGQPFAEWRKSGRDRASEVGDPRFTDPAKGDYSPRPGSPAYRLGFEALPPLRQWGPRRRPCTCAIAPAGPRFWGSRGGSGQPPGPE